jgi:hypothetical protein
MANPKICRIGKLKGFDNILAGRDFAGIFKDGHVYSVVDMMGQIMFTDLGEAANLDEHWEKPQHSLSTYIRSGLHLITDKEYKIEKQSEESEYE